MYRGDNFQQGELTWQFFAQVQKESQGKEDK